MSVAPCAHDELSSGACVRMLCSAYFYCSFAPRHRCILQSRVATQGRHLLDRHLDVSIHRHLSQRLHDSAHLNLPCAASNDSKTKTAICNMLFSHGDHLSLGDAGVSFVGGEALSFSLTDNLLSLRSVD